MLTAAEKRALHPFEKAVVFILEQHQRGADVPVSQTATELLSQIKGVVRDRDKVVSQALKAPEGSVKE